MTTIFAFSLFGFDVPDFGLVIPLVLFALLFLALNRNGGLESGANVTGVGRMVQCERCGRRFQPARNEVLHTGDVQSTYDDSCPNCGWDMDWGDPDKSKPGGASGGW